jgi:DNA invertase Pin-like site-specific DNA recombinase
MLVGYARASTEDQPLHRQIDVLVAAGVDKRNIYCENISGTKRNRPELNRMLVDLQPGDIIVFTELSRLSRSLMDTLEISNIIRQKDAGIKSLKEGELDTTTANGRLQFSMMAVLAEWQRNMTSEQTKEGLKAAKARGRCGGRPSKQNEKTHLVKMLYDSGMGPMAIFRELDESISVSTIKRIIRGLQDAEAEINT